METKTRKLHIESIIGNIYAIRRKFSDSGAAKNGQHDITSSQWAVLARVLKKENIGVKELGRELGITSSAITQLVDELVLKGYLVRQSSRSDRRALSLKLSDLRKKQIFAIKARTIRRLTSMFNALNDEELARYDILNKKIVGGWTGTKQQK
jgi:DNA-binding MarR family transcriptional regulator